MENRARNTEEILKTKVTQGISTQEAKAKVEAQRKPACPKLAYSTAVKQILPAQIAEKENLKISILESQVQQLQLVVKRLTSEVKSLTKALNPPVVPVQPKDRAPAAKADPAKEDVRGKGRTQQAPVVHINRDLADNQPDQQDDSPSICNPDVDENQPGRGDNEAQGDLTPVTPPSEDDTPKEDDVMQPFNQENDSPLDLSLTSSVALPITPNIQKSGHDTAGHCSIIITKKDPIPPRKPPSTTSLTTPPRKSSSTTILITKNAEKSKKKLLVKRKATKILSPRRRPPTPPKFVSPGITRSGTPLRKNNGYAKIKKK